MGPSRVSGPRRVAVVQNSPVSTNPAAVPFSAPARPELTGGRKVGVLLSHGFTGSPFSIRPWAEFLAEKGYAVESPLLPGHGTTWRDLNKHRFEDFYRKINETFEKLEAENDAVVVGGLSMGGTLTMRLACDRADEIAGLVVVNPVLGTRRKDVKALPLVKWIVPAFPAIANDIKKPGMDEHAYSRTPLKAIHSLFQAFPKLISDLSSLKVPTLVYRAPQDHVVDSFSIEAVTHAMAGRDLTIEELPNSYHVATLDNDAETIFEGSLQFIRKVTS